MKLKKLLMLAFAVLTIIPSILFLLLFYKSGVELSKESYTRNLSESIHVQADFLSQTIENDMIFDSRFLMKNYAVNGYAFDSSQKDNLLTAFQYYLESSEDRVSVCILFDGNNQPIYTIGESNALNSITAQLPKLSDMTEQQIKEFDMSAGSKSLGIITPVTDKSGAYAGCLVSVYDELYLFKIISSYYEITDTSTYICTKDGTPINLGGYANEPGSSTMKQELQTLELDGADIIDINSGSVHVLGYYKNIYNTPWYLVGLINQQQIYAFTNHYVWVYIIIILIIIIISILLSINFSQRVVAPINRLIEVMDGYPDSLKGTDIDELGKQGYFETKYLQKKFLNLMQTIMLVQHNFEGVYQLYQSSDMEDTNIDIDVIQQTIQSNKDAFSDLIHGLEVPPNACIVERFTRCFCDKDQVMLMNMFTDMRDEHLAVMQEAEVFTPHLGQKWFHVLTVPMYEGERLSKLFVQLRDISNYKRQEHESNEQSRRDALTGLWNRTGFKAQVDAILAEQVPDAQHGILFIDMDNFKLVNDNFGHSTGDDLLRSVSQTLLDTLGDTGFPARFGGDEFAVFLPYASTETVLSVKKTLNHQLIYPYQKGDISFQISASIGESIWKPADSISLEDLLKQADEDMYCVKRAQKSC